MIKKLGSNGLETLWNRVLAAIKRITGDVDVSTDGTLQSQISTVKNKLDGIEEGATNYIPTKISGTLKAGNTSITLSNSAIKTSSYIDVYTSIYGVSPKNISISTGKAVLTFDAQTEDMTVAVVII